MRLTEALVLCVALNDLLFAEAGCQSEQQGKRGYVEDCFQALSSWSSPLVYPQLPSDWGSLREVEAYAAEQPLSLQPVIESIPEQQ